MEEGALMPDVGLPLLRAVFLRRLRLTRVLLEGGAYINESDSLGQSPLMVACRTQYTDFQSSSRARLVQYLLERGADPNIQDKMGRSALMYACLDQAGAEVVSLLLASGADPGLEDHSGTSALVLAVTTGDQEVLKLLLDTCRAQGKEVIIINSDELYCEKPRTKQYLNGPPLAPLDIKEIVQPQPGPPCASPSEIQILTSPQCSSPKQIFSFRERQCSRSGGEVSSQPCSPSRGRDTLERLRQPFQRLNSELWLRIPASLLALQPRGPQEEFPDFRSDKDLSFRHCSRLGRNPAGNKDKFTFQGGNYTSDHTVNRPLVSLTVSESEDKGQREVGMDGEEERGGLGKLLGNKTSSLFSSHSASHPNLHSQFVSTNSGSHTSSSSTGEIYPCPPFPSLAMSSLHNILHKRHLGADHYSSDPQLAVQGRSLTEQRRTPLGSRRLATSRSSTLLGSVETPNLSRSSVIGPETRESGGLVLEPPSHSRLGSLPPLANNHNLFGGANSHLCSTGRVVCGAVPGGQKTFLPSAPPGQPKDMTRRMLLRRHSMQTEQIKKLGGFNGIFSR